MRTALQAQYGDGGSGFIGVNLSPAGDCPGLTTGVSTSAGWNFFPAGPSDGSQGNGGPGNVSCYSGTVEIR